MVTKFIPKDQETGVEDAAVRNNLLLPSVSCLHFGFWILRLVPTPTSIGLRFVFPFKYLHRLHYDSMIGPALVYPQVLHVPWTYEPQRTRPYPEFCLLLHWSWYLCCLHFWFFLILLPSYTFCLYSWLCILLLHLSRISTAFLSGFCILSSSLVLIFPFAFYRFSLGPPFSDPVRDV